MATGGLGAFGLAPRTQNSDSYRVLGPIILEI